MVDRIAQIVCENLLNLELISPNRQAVRSFIAKLRLLLGRENLRGGNLAPDQVRQVEADHFHYVFAEFQLIERQELAHQGIHLSGFIDNDIAVIVPGFRIVIDAVLQALRVPLDQGQRGLELMGNIGKKFPALIIHFYLFIQISLKLIIRRLKL